MEPRVGFEPTTCCLQNSCSNRLSYLGNTFLTIWWAEQDSNLRRRKPTDLQSVPVVHLGICPLAGAEGVEPSSSVLETDIMAVIRRPYSPLTREMLNYKIQNYKKPRLYYLPFPTLVSLCKVCLRSHLQYFLSSNRSVLFFLFL